MIQPYTKGIDISIMVWGAIWVNGRSDLVLMDRDDDSKGGGIQPTPIFKFLMNRYPNASS